MIGIFLFAYSAKPEKGNRDFFFCTAIFAKILGNRCRINLNDFIFAKKAFHDPNDIHNQFGIV